MTAVQHNNDPSNCPDSEEPAHYTPEQLIRKYQAGTWRYLRFLGADEGQVDDLVQEAFLAVLRREASGKFQQRSAGETSAYLRQVARNLLFASRRKEGRAPDTVAIEAADAAENIWANVACADGLEDYLDALRVCLDSLTVRARRALDLFYQQQHSRDEVAEQMEMKADGIKTLLRRSRQSLRECVERKVKS